MFNSVLRAIFISAAALLLSTAAFAWDETGHKITAYIAWQQMTPEVRDKVIKILRSAPEDSQLATFYMPYGSRSEDARKREFFLIAATWADIIKDRDAGVRYDNYNHSNWHYFDTLWMQKDGKVVIVPDAEPNGHMMEKLADFDKVIRGSASNSDKAIAIAWLEHLIGDLHQPLHATARAAGDDDKKGDQGGNLFSLTPKGAKDKLNLHSYWDGIIRQNFPNTNDACEADYLYPIAQSIIKDFPYSKLQSRIANNKYEVWEKESIEIATTEVYKGLKRYEMPSDDYKKKSLKIAEERMALGGYRLGNLLNEVFGAPSTPAVLPASPSPSPTPATTPTAE